MLSSWENVSVITGEWPPVGEGEGGRKKRMIVIWLLLSAINPRRGRHVTFMICSPPRGWTRLARDGEVVSHRDGEVGALTPLAGLSLGPGGAAHWARAHWQSDPFPGATKRVGCGAWHPAVRGGPGHLHITEHTKPSWQNRGICRMKGLKEV